MTIFCDIDGTLLEQVSNDEDKAKADLAMVHGAADVTQSWKAKGWRIILVSGRPEALREATKKNLDRHGIEYDDLILGLSADERVVVNDIKCKNRPKAIAVNLPRNHGFGEFRVTYLSEKERIVYRDAESATWQVLTKSQNFLLPGSVWADKEDFLTDGEKWFYVDGEPVADATSALLRFGKQHSNKIGVLDYL